MDQQDKAYFDKKFQSIEDKLTKPNYDLAKQTVKHYIPTYVTIIIIGLIVTGLALYISFTTLGLL